MLPTSRPVGGEQARIKEGDLVIVYENLNSMKAVHVDPKGRFDNRFGSFIQKEWIGLPFGSKAHACGSSRGWVYLLAPTPDLWSLVLRHRTQILYIADISVICMYLELSPGAIVLESGTGSGSLTHSLARAVAPTGHVYSFEHHLERTREAAAEAQANGLGSVVSIRHHDVEGQGFPCGQQNSGQQNSGQQNSGQHNSGQQNNMEGGPSSTGGSQGACSIGQAEGTGANSMSGGGQQGGDKEAPGSIGGRRDEGLNLAGTADAVFLDLPAPPKAIPSAAVCLKPNGRICSFSPCIEQVQNVCRALELAGFTDIMTVECLLRTHEVRTERVDTLTRATPQEQPEQQEVEGEGAPKRARIEPQGVEEDGTTDKGGECDGGEGGGEEATEVVKQQGEDGEPGVNASMEQEQQQQQQQQAGSVRGLGQGAEGGGTAKGTPSQGGQARGKGGKGRGGAGRQQSARPGGLQLQSSTRVCSCPMQQAKGHTGYLTFARKWVG